MEFLKAALPWITAGLSVLVLVINHVKSGKSARDDKDTEGNYMTEGMCLGLCIGLAFGSEWMSLGMLIGLAVGVLVKKK